MARTYSKTAEPRYVERAKTADEAGTEVIANPTLVGTESNLTSLKINGTKYKVLPVVTGSDVGKFLRVDSNGYIVAETIPNANTASF